MSNQTENQIKFIKDTFQQFLSGKLQLQRVTAPLFIESGKGINDDLSGNEKPVSFYVPALGINCEIVQSLAKWKRMKLGELGLEPGNGIYTDMNAIRPNEIPDELHSIYVDQWDWEKVITETNWNNGGLTCFANATAIYDCIKATEYMLNQRYPDVKQFLPDMLIPITSELLGKRYPGLSPKEREYEFCKEMKAVFIGHIGGPNHDGNRAPDYDDWDKNGDILIWSPILNAPIEISSMGVRVNAESLHNQLQYAGKLDWESLQYHSMVLHNRLPLTIGGGIGQSRLCMLLLQKKHIGEVQVSVWDKSNGLENNDVHILK